MNKFFKSVLTVMALAAAVISLPVKSQAQQVGQISGAMSLFTNSVSNATNTSTAGTALTIEHGVGLTLMPNTVAAGAGTSNSIFGFNVSVDGTNFTTTWPLRGTNVNAGTNGVTGLIIFTPAQLQHIKNIRWDYFETQQTNAVTISNIFYGFYR